MRRELGLRGQVDAEAVARDLGFSIERRPLQHLVELASRCEVSTDWLLGRESVEEEVLGEAEVSFRNAVASLPREDIEEIKNFIAFVREQRRRKG